MVRPRAGRELIVSSEDVETAAGVRLNGKRGDIGLVIVDEQPDESREGRDMTPPPNWRKLGNMRGLIAVVTMVLLTGEVHARQCLTKATMAAELDRQYGEVEFATAVSASNVIKFYSNPSRRTWSLVLVRPDGMACIIAAGEDLEPSKTVRNLPLM